jgi:hypothetical protein
MPKHNVTPHFIRQEWRLVYYIDVVLLAPGSKARATQWRYTEVALLLRDRRKLLIEHFDQLVAAVAEFVILV